MKNNVKILFLSMGPMIAVSITQSMVAQEKQPNVLFVLTDDQPYDMLGCMGRYSFLNTPAQDRLVREGVLFNNYFCVQSLSSPSRASLLTGVYPHVHGVTLHHKDIEPDWKCTRSYQQILHDVGYQTAFFGKIHMATKAGKEHVRPGYDYWVSFNGQGQYFDPIMNINGTEQKVEGYMTEILTNATLDWLKNKRDSSKPFSICLWHKAVHAPMECAPRYKELYQDAYVSDPPYDTHLDNLANKPEYQRVRVTKQTETPPSSVKLDKRQKNKETALKISRTLQSVDESLAQVLAYLEKIGELENTIVIYSSDNGYLLGEHRLGDKRLAYENSIRIPLIIRYPRLFPVHKVNEMCLNIDVAPTILDALGIQVPEIMQGTSMVPLLKGEETKWRDKFMYECFCDPQFPTFNPNLIAIRTDRYKLVINELNYDIDELYDLQEDPGEMNNLIKDPAYKKIRVQLKSDLEKLKKDTGYNPDRAWRLEELGVDVSKLRDYPRRM